jgi:hypothetical protein
MVAFVQPMKPVKKQLTPKTSSLIVRKTAAPLALLPSSSACSTGTRSLSAPSGMATSMCRRR